MPHRSHSSAGTRHAAAVAALLAVAVAAPGCRSILPRADDSTLEAIGKGVFWVPVCLALVVVDGNVEDETSVSPVDLLSGDCSGYGEWSAERDAWAERILTERDLHPLGR